MAAVSALAGNDYSLPRRFASALCSARSAIVQSDIGGLRRKERNAPSAKATATAVIRFVGHFASRGRKEEGGSRDKAIIRNSSWLWQLVIAATNEGKGKNEREGTYMKLFYLCGISKKRRIVNTEKNQRRGRKKRTNLAPNDCNQSLSCRSVWMLPCLVNTRQKMYNIINYLSKAKKESRRLLSVQESCRVGTSEFKEVSVYNPKLPSSSAIFVDDDSSDAFRGMLDYCFYRDNVCVGKHLNQLPSSFWYPFLSSVLLPSGIDALLLFVIVNAPRGWRGLIDVQTCVPVSEELLSTARWMQLALYHTNLVFDALTYCATVDGVDLTFDKHAVNAYVQAIIQEEVAGEESFDVDSGFMDVIFESIARAFKGIESKASMDEWRFSSCSLWE
eukprot:CAMPEP_0178535202 /NCGR_PEP_ID=MMETSP0696-20121128/35423_1 /TAXON_ID=265572 /ORGANISM="Extubocellulus spinifer, Strain CCMP396" /LENGTH=388 /DNA_ID=CAMNT_0020167333 /DNA_START=182 /DNA_END=1347 /DNA_ORIENTATION=-